MKFKYAILIITVVSLAIMLASCSKQPVEPIVITPNDISTNVVAENVVNANTLFSADVYNLYNEEEKNIFFSSYSISSALTMTYEGAKGQTAEEMKKVLHLPSDKNITRSDFRTINEEINAENKSFQLSVVNALWAQEEYPFIEDYFTIVDTYYGGKVSNLNFANNAESSRKEINDWVEQQTSNRIKNLLSKGSVSPSTKLILTNAIYFKGDWNNKFKTRYTEKEKFMLSSGQEVNVLMMHKTSYYNYGETNNVQILEMDYEGREISMLVILPKENSDVIDKDIDGKTIREWQDSVGRAKVEVSFPKFKFETEYSMANDLQQMGMSAAFNPTMADFTGMTTKEELFISQVVHKTFVEVTEEGTEAAAATAVSMMASSAGPGEPEEIKVFKADHPFIFIIQQKDSGNILFMGKVNNPE